MKVVIGTRTWLGADWFHVDGDPGFLRDADGGHHPVDLVSSAERIALPTGCAELVYSQECLEHMPWARCPAVVAEWARLVGDGGALRIEVPDFLAACRQVLDGDSEEMDFAIQQIIFGGQRDRWDYHATGVTPRMLTRWVTDAGLTVVDLRRGWVHGWLMIEATRGDTT